ncbi:uncharacterized protein LOC142609093 [Castanea sativa]|uniref:uncharacterized protein LOC142609093 n=1 Tax=Castanea sativa TaxID=21020 RepID=UPI003F64CEA3
MAGVGVWRCYGRKGLMCVSKDVQMRTSTWWFVRVSALNHGGQRGSTDTLMQRQCDLPWVVFRDFNEIVQSDKKLGWLDRDARQMEIFRECLFDCGLRDLGLVGQRFTWCNGRFSEQRSLVRLDRFVANEEWMKMFLEGKVFHKAMASSDHCLLKLSLRQRVQRRRSSKRFMFEAMWTREEGC